MKRKVLGLAVANIEHLRRAAVAGSGWSGSNSGLDVAGLSQQRSTFNDVIDIGEVTLHLAVVETLIGSPARIARANSIGAISDDPKVHRP